MDIGVFNLLIVCWCFLCLLICDYKWCKKLNLYKYNIIMGWGWLLFLPNDLKRKRIRVLFVSQVSIHVAVLCDTVSLNQHYLLIDLKHKYSHFLTILKSILLSKKDRIEVTVVVGTIFQPRQRIKVELPWEYEPFRIMND